MTRPRPRSEMARDAMNQFCTVFRDRSVPIAMQTSKFPITISIMIHVMKIANSTSPNCVYPDPGYGILFQFVYHGPPLPSSPTNAVLTVSIDPLLLLYAEDVEEIISLVTFITFCVRKADDTTTCIIRSWWWWGLTPCIPSFIFIISSSFCSSIWDEDWQWRMTKWFRWTCNLNDNNCK